jgi:hypothetical protein
MVARATALTSRSKRIVGSAIVRPTHPHVVRPRGRTHPPLRSLLPSLLNIIRQAVFVFFFFCQAEDSLELMVRLLPIRSCIRKFGIRNLHYRFSIWIRIRRNSWRDPLSPKMPAACLCDGQTSIGETAGSATYVRSESLHWRFPAICCGSQIAG